MKKSQRFAALGLSAVMAASAMAGCSSGGDNNETTTANPGSTQDSQQAASVPAPDDTVTLDVFSQVANYSGIQMGWSGQIFLEKFNVKLNMIQDTNGALATRMAEGNLGDIVVFGSRGDDYDQCIKQGLLLNWNKDNLLDNYGPYLKENLKAALDYNKELNGGTCYGFNGSVCSEGSAGSAGLLYTWDTRWDLYEQLGKPEIKNLDDYLQLMIDMKAICPTDENGKETYALSMWPDWDGNMVMYVKAFATAYYGYDEFGIGLYDVRTGEMHGALEPNGPYYTSLKFINKLYQNNLVDPNSQTQDYAKMTEKMKAGGCFFSIFNYAGGDIYNTKQHTDQNKMMCPLIPTEATPIIYEASQTGSGYDWAIGSKTKYPELCMSIINWLATPEGALTYYWGPKGLTWDYNEQGQLYLTELGIQAQDDRRGTIINYNGTNVDYENGSFQVNSSIWDKGSLIPGDPLGQVFDYKNWDLMMTGPCCDVEAAWREYSGETLPSNFLLHWQNSVIAPATGVQSTKPGKKDPLFTNWNSVIDTVTTGTWRCIYAKTDEEFEKLFAQMVADAEAFNYAGCMEYTQKEADARHEIEILMTE
ncbi:MAG: extracellular solute-binding protein [Lachnospiraceae bacterium]|nr:extracellular solute-binding protein [Lachnospiraceae bacterium]